MAEAVAENKNKANTEANGTPGKPEGKKGKREKAVVVCDTETELTQIAPPVDNKGNTTRRFKVTRDDGTTVAYTYAYNKADAILNVLRKKPVLEAKALGANMPTLGGILADLGTIAASGVDLPPELRAYVAKVNASSHQAPSAPKGAHKK